MNVQQNLAIQSQAQAQVVPNGWYSIFHVASSLALDVSGEDDDAAMVFIYTGQVNQLWLVQNHGGGAWSIQNANGRFLSLRTDRGVPAPMLGSAVLCSEMQHPWMLIPDPTSPGTFRFWVPNTMLVADPPDASAATVAGLYPYDPTMIQTWRLATPAENVANPGTTTSRRAHRRSDPSITPAAYDEV
ncbi:hypothetical protein DL93DRAFT_2227904 [Clavulina sp. PMI_390]|nr:hypothetical protein DL93DRAFT_2227904 [Clavulina sp. PMI_390]